jgi:hypothetical protein
MLAALAPTGLESDLVRNRRLARPPRDRAGSPAPALFPSIPGGVFPVYHLFAEWAPWAAAEVGRATSSAPLQVAVFALRRRVDGGSR